MGASAARRGRATSRLSVAGVLLVFSYLIVPALAGIMLGGRTAARLGTGWVFGTVVSIVGIAASATLDLPTGATVVCAFGLTLLLLAVVQLLRGGHGVAARAQQTLRTGARQ